MIIRIRNLQKIKKIKLSELRRDVGRALRILNIRDKTLHCVLSDNRFIREINKSYFKKDRATDVISFPLEDRLCPGLLGEVVVSVEEAAENSKVYAVSFYRELMLYIVHGILHLIGYRDGNTRDRDRMERKQREILEQVLCSREAGKDD